MQRLLRSSFLRAAFVLASGTTLAQVIPFLLTPILTRLFTPDDMGVFSLYFSFVIVFLGALSLGFTYALVSADEEDVLGLLSLCIYSIALLTAPISGIALFLIHQDLLGFGDLSKWAVLSIALSLIVTELFTVLRYAVLREGKYRILANATVNQSIARIGSQVLMGFVNLGWWGLTFGDAVGRAVGVRKLWLCVPYSARDILSGSSWNRLKEIARKYRDFPYYSAPGAIVDSLSAQIVAPLLAVQFGLAVAGQYGIVLRLVILPVTLVGGSVADVFHNRLAEAARAKSGSAERLFLAVAAGLLVVGLILAGVLVLLNNGIWGAVLGEQWAEAGQYAVAIAPRAAAAMVTMPVSRTVLVFGGQKIKLAYNLFNIVTVISAMQLASQVDWNALETITAVSWAQAGASVVYFLLQWKITRRGSMETSTLV